MALTDRHHENEKFSTFLKIFQTTKKGSGAFTHESAIIIGFHCIVSAPVAVTGDCVLILKFDWLINFPYFYMICGFNPIL